MVSDMKIRIQHIDDPSGLANAISFPNGTIRVTSVMANILSDAEMEASILHEKHHIDRQHALMRNIIGCLLLFFVTRKIGKGDSFLVRRMKKGAFNLASTVAINWATEFSGDHAAKKAGYGCELASALRKVYAHNYTVAPVLKYSNWMTHPPVSVRVKLLKKGAK